MRKYFGTDGVRGVANKELTPELAFKLGRVGGYVLTKHTHETPKVIIGRDTRVSGYMLENAMAAGLMSIGAEVVKVGVISTPGVSFLVENMHMDAGVMISASHNPVEDNGIKFFGSDGFKLSDELELEIEELLESDEDILPRPVGTEIQMRIRAGESIYKYIDKIKSVVNHDFAGLKVGLDTANGATYKIAPILFSDLGAEVHTIHCTPDGYNINKQCGSTHPEELAAYVVENNLDLGLAFDGDGDRLIAIDHEGTIIDGDYLLLIFGQYLRSRGELKKDTVVSTVMSNLGYKHAVTELGLQSSETAVGDRYVMEEMLSGGYSLGGEQSGHIIFLDAVKTGDGMLSGAILAKIIATTGKSLKELCSVMQKYPQVLKNIRVQDSKKVLEHTYVQEVIASVEETMNGNGRVLVRPSGTEPLIRVMVEAETETLCESFVDEILQAMESVV